MLTVTRFRISKTLLARATPLRSGDQRPAAETGEERIAAQFALADLPLRTFLNEPVVPYEADEVTRLIIDVHDKAAFARIAHLTVGDFRDWLLSDEATADALGRDRRRIKVAVPVAGITDLHNHVVDGCVEGHCDCMFFVNTYRWDYPAVAALAVPRPLLIANCDKDTIFPLDGVSRLYWKVRGVYGLGKQDEPYHPPRRTVGLPDQRGRPRRQPGVAGRGVPLVQPAP